MIDIDVLEVRVLDEGILRVIDDLNSVHYDIDRASKPATVRCTWTALLLLKQQLDLKIRIVLSH